MQHPISQKLKSIFFLALILLSGVIAGPRSQVAASQGPEQTEAGNFQIFLPIILKDANPSGGEFVFQALSDANIVLPEGTVLTTFLASQKIFLCDITEPIPTNPLTYAQAQVNIWVYLNNQVGAENLATFRTLPESATADTAQAFAVAAIADRRPDGALASFMVAAEKATSDPMVLVSAAGVLNMLGLPNEALAFLDYAATLPGELVSPMGISGTQIAANNRGHALMVMGRWQEAETVLRPVAESEGELSEARTNLSIALLCQDKDDEAGYFYRMGARRRLYDVVKDGEEIGGRLPLDVIYDRSAGQTLTLPGVPIAPNPEQTDSLIATYNQMSDSHLSRFQQNATQLDTVTNEIIARQPSLPLLTNLRYANVIGALNSASQEPYILELKESYAEAEENLITLDDQQDAELLDLFEQGLPLDQLYPACRDLLMGHWGSLKLTLQAYEDTRREHAMALYYEQTGLAANLADPLHHEAASLRAKQMAESAFGDIVGLYSVFNTGMAASWWECLGTPTATDEAGDAPTLEESEACPSFVKGVKLAVKVAGLSINVNCEKIEMEASASQAMSLFGQVTVDLKRDSVTAFVGAKGKINLGPMELSAKEGLYVTANKGGLTDAGMKVSTTGALNVGQIAGKIDGPGFEFSVVSAMQYIMGPSSP